MKKTFIILGLVAMVAGLGHADIIVKPVDATASSTMGNSNDYAAEKGVSGAGLTADIQTGDAVPVSWSGHSADQADHWISGDEAWGAGKWIAFDLGATYTLTGMHVWNYNNTFIESSRGAKDVLVQYQVGASWVDAESFVFTKGASLFSGYTGEDYAFTSSITAQNIRFLVTSNHGGGNYASIGEVRFTAVPEPMTMALLALGGLPLLRKRRK